MKKLISLLLVIIMIVCSVVTVFAYNPDYNYEPAEEPSSIDISDLFIDGRTITPEQAAQMLDFLGLYYCTDNEGNRSLRFSNRVILLAEIDDIEAFCADPEGCEKLAESLGFNSEYVRVELDGTHMDWIIQPGDGRTYYDLLYGLTPKGRELLGYDEMSLIDKLYVEVLMLCGQSFMTEPIMGAEDYTKSEDYKLDVNLDGSFNAKDVAYMKKYMSGGVTAINLAAADQDGDGHINVRDLQSIKRKITGAN